MIWTLSDLGMTSLESLGITQTEAQYVLSGSGVNGRIFKQALSLFENAAIPVS